MTRETPGSGRKGGGPQGRSRATLQDRLESIRRILDQSGAAQDEALWNELWTSLGDLSDEARDLDEARIGAHVTGSADSEAEGPGEARSESEAEAALTLEVPIRGEAPAGGCPSVSVSLVRQPLRGRALIVADTHSSMVDGLERELTAASFAPAWVKPDVCEVACVGASVVLVDVAAGGDGYNLCGRLARLPQGPRYRILYTERNGGFEVLRLVSSHAHRMIHRPFELRTVLRPENVEGRVCQSKILIVDPIEADRAFAYSTLTEAGHIVEVGSGPVDLLEDLARFRPDLLLLEWDLPGVNGADLARVVRSDARHEILPIVFLTERSGRQEWRDAARAGADGFLTKPLTGPDLLESLEIQLKRSRILRRRLDADSLTDLLNRAASLAAVDDLLQASDRKGQFVLVAIIDIDNFKRVNDELGHPAGDRVLRELSTHLATHLGPGDVAGRLGGEELIIATAGMEPDRLLANLDKIRESLRIELRANDGVSVRRVTFSAGAAIFPTQGTQTADLLKLADLALYEAKTRGRNRVSLAAVPGVR